MHHKLKTHPAMFRAVRDGVKNFEVRKDDRAFQAGDTVTLIFHDMDTGSFCKPPKPYDPSDDLTDIEKRITFVLRGGQYGVEHGYVVLALGGV